MRLLKTGTGKLEFQEFIGDNIPLYAILSHTWGDDEVSLQDVQGGHADTKAGYQKIKGARSIAAHHGFDFIWIDTCCIDKTSSAELSEAINSMFRWYQRSGLCYVYLADVPSNVPSGQARSDTLAASRWFTRGWTLQELIAPSMVIFLSQEWQEIGTKSSLQSIISHITGIPNAILQGANVQSASIAQRMSWASSRKTTRSEDIAYCLMGLFGVNMPMLYGEGEKAFLRLQEEILKASDDHSFFTWETSNHHGGGGRGLLAPSPAAFARFSKIIPRDSSSTLSGAITVNNKGIHLKVRFMDIKRAPSQRVMLAILPCKSEGKDENLIGVHVKAISETKEYFERIRTHKVEIIAGSSLNYAACKEGHICVRKNQLVDAGQPPLTKAVEEGNETVVALLLERGTRPGKGSLLSAVQNRHETVARLLLGKGIQPDAKLLSEAVGNKHRAVVELLLSVAARNGYEELLPERGQLDMVLLSRLSRMVMRW